MPTNYFGKRLMYHYEQIGVPAASGYVTTECNRQVTRQLITTDPTLVECKRCRAVIENDLRPWWSKNDRDSGQHLDD